MKSALSVARIALATVVVAGIGDVAIAQDYPTRPIRLIVPQSAGGGADIFAFVNAEIAKWNKLVTDSGAELD
jgi:tripartite-type tricarboxylate transporter receptor subunit TctC